MSHIGEIKLTKRDISNIKIPKNSEVTMSYIYLYHFGIRQFHQVFNILAHQNTYTSLLFICYGYECVCISMNQDYIIYKNISLTKS